MLCYILLIKMMLQYIYVSAVVRIMVILHHYGLSIQGSPFAKFMGEKNCSSYLVCTLNLISTINLNSRIQSCFKNFPAPFKTIEMRTPSSEEVKQSNNFHFKHFFMNVDQEVYQMIFKRSQLKSSRHQQTCCVFNTKQHS